ncbi:MAG: hypothetical protein LBQ93_03740 [Treponema sp.]|jgi:hypothetical protein|nr:hypothetical protein [Treponema sp.]
MVESVINRKERFATEGIRFQRHNGDGTIPTSQRFLGFANTTDLTKLIADNDLTLTIKIDDAPSVTKTVDFSGVVNQARVTVQEAVAALNAANIPDIVFDIDARTERLKGSCNSGTKAQVAIALSNDTGSGITIPAGNYAITIGNNNFMCLLTNPLVIADEKTANMLFLAANAGVLSGLPVTGADVSLSLIAPALPNVTNEGFTGAYGTVANGTNSALTGKIIQVVGKLAAALDFGNCLKHGGNGLEVISFFDDETISIGLPKDIKDKEEIDVEGVRGTITRMIIGAMVQGMSPVVTLKEKDYYLLELIQGGSLDRETGTYNPPLSNEGEHPSFWAEIFSGIYSSGSNKLSDVAGYERLLLRTMTGMEGDVPIDAKAWAQYAFNLVATEYTDENDIKFPAWEEQTLSATQFDALNVKGVKI